MAGIGLGFALKTTEYRRSNDFRVRATSPIQLTTPTEWVGLYLPKRANLLAGMQVAELRQTTLGKQLLAEPRPALLELAKR